MNRLPLAALCLGLVGAAGAQSTNQQQGNPPSGQGTGTNPSPPPSSTNNSQQGASPTPGENSPVLLGHPGGGPAVPPDEKNDRPRDTGGRIGPGSSSPSRRPAQGAGGHRSGENDGGKGRDVEPDEPVEG